MKILQQGHPTVWFKDRNDEKILILKPPYQRKPVWSPDQKAYLIDTMLKGYLIPEVYIHRETDSNGKSKFNVVDGQQRIRSILDFIKGEFTLSGEYSPEYVDFNFKDLPQDTKKKIWEYTIRVCEITEASENDVRNLFMRINKNVVSLNPQELRHATYSGEFIRLMEEIAELDYWAENKIVTAKEIKRMNDVQYVSDLFISMINGIQDKTKEMDTYYENYETNFKEKSKWYKRFLDIREMISTIFPNIRETRWKNKSDFYSLFMVLNELTVNKSQPILNYKKINNDLIKFSEKVTLSSLKENKTKKYSKDVVDYMNAVTKSTTDKDRRLMRHKILKKIIAKYVK